MLQKLNIACERCGMKINIRKTKIMVIGGKGENADKREDKCCQVDSFKSLIEIDEESWKLCTKEINIRIAIAKEGLRGCFKGHLKKGLRKKQNCFVGH